MTVHSAIPQSSFEGPDNETLADRIADQLNWWIITGQVKPGQKLIEKDIATNDASPAL